MSTEIRASVSSAVLSCAIRRQRRQRNLSRHFSATQCKYEGLLSLCSFWENYCWSPFACSCGSCTRTLLITQCKRPVRQLLQPMVACLRCVTKLGEKET
ncbi:hypothetical protein BaRGS_00006720 [Batillaria attramentaria]|uniref:Uncharacterized protein n=1 Tax=Batillaria attramentaria TaxID=370345 RepID=A0ABD0LR45_9CAEN